MEYQTALLLTQHGYVPKSWLNLSARYDEIVALCRAQRNAEPSIACWQEIVHGVSATLQHDAKKVFDLCSTATLPEAAKECRRHTIHILNDVGKFNLQRIASICLLPQRNDPTFKADCYMQLVSSTLSALPNDFARVTKYCGVIAEPYATACRTKVDELKKANTRIESEEDD